MPLEWWMRLLAIGLDHILRHLFYWPSCQNRIDPPEDMCFVIIMKQMVVG
jgi:hypothetical protein